MRVGNVRRNGELVAAIVEPDRAFPLRVIPTDPAGDHGPALEVVTTLGSGLESVYEDALSAIASGQLEPVALAELGPPIVQPGKIICVGRNYAEHARETGSAIPERPILFSKFATAIVGPFDDIVRPAGVDDLDYEAELCVIIGRRGRHIPRQRALDHVVGYCCANDVSARTAQLSMGDQWLRGKSFDTFCPIGPAIVTRDEIADPQTLRIGTRVGGVTMQDDTTANMIFDVATLVSYCSDAFTLQHGDVILTGTPPGVALGRTPPPWLQPGQLCEVEIEGVGRIANRITQE